MKELRFDSTTYGINSADDDCMLDPTDPIHEFKRTGNAHALSQPKRVPMAQQFNEHERKLELAKQQGIKPGTPAWYML